MDQMFSHADSFNQLCWELHDGIDLEQFFFLACGVHMLGPSAQKYVEERAANATRDDLFEGYRDGTDAMIVHLEELVANQAAVMAVQGATMARQDAMMATQTAEMAELRGIIERVQGWKQKVRQGTSHLTTRKRGKSRKSIEQVHKWVAALRTTSRTI